MTRVDLCVARLFSEERYRQYPYNDATGARVTCRPGGNLTWLVGCNLETAGTPALAKLVLAHQLGEFDAELKTCPWYGPLDEPRGSVFLDCAFNEGFMGLLRHAATAIHFAGLSDWANCVTAFLAMGPAKQLPKRYGPLSEILKTGAV